MFPSHKWSYEIIPHLQWCSESNIFSDGLDFVCCKLLYSVICLHFAKYILDSFGHSHIKYSNWTLIFWLWFCYVNQSELNYCSLGYWHSIII